MAWMSAHGNVSSIPKRMPTFFFRIGRASYRRSLHVVQPDCLTRPADERMPGDVRVRGIASRSGQDGLAQRVPSGGRHRRPDAAPGRKTELVERRAGEDFEGKAVDVALATDLAQTADVLTPVEVAVGEDALAVSEGQLVEPGDVVGVGDQRSGEHP